MNVFVSVLGQDDLAHLVQGRVYFTSKAPLALCGADVSHAPKAAPIDRACQECKAVLLAKEADHEQ